MRSPIWRAPDRALFDEVSRANFREALDVDDATGLRARAFELEHAVGGVLHHTPLRHPLGDLMARTLNRIRSSRTGSRHLAPLARHPGLGGRLLGRYIGTNRQEHVMPLELLDLYSRASTWTNERISGAATQLDARTPCEDWDVRTLLDHMLETQRYFLGAARGEQVSPPSPTPPRLITDDPGADFERTRGAMLDAYGEPGVVDETGPALGIAFSDQLLHGWDLARATGQDATMPEGLADAAYELIHGRFTDEERKGVFEPEVPVPAGASSQDKLLAYTGRQPI